MDGRNLGAVLVPQLQCHVTPLGNDVRVLQEVLGGKVRDGYRLPVRQGVPHRQQDDPWFLEERPHLQAVLVDGQSYDADVRPAVEQHLHLIVPSGAQQAHIHVWMVRGEGDHGRGDRNAGHEADGQRLSSLRRRFHPPDKCLGRGEQGNGVLQQLLAGWSEQSAPTATVEHFRSEFVLQAANLPGEDGLGDVQSLGRPSEVEFLCHCYEVSELPQIKVHPESPLAFSLKWPPC